MATLAVDLSTPRLRWALVVEDELERRGTLSYPELDDLAVHLEKIVSGLPRQPERLILIIDGCLDQEQAVIVSGARPLVSEALPLGDQIDQALGIETILLSSAQALALALEGTVAVLSVGAGVSAALLVNNQLYRGAAGRASEVGHLAYLPGGLACLCSRHGCVQAYAGWQAAQKRWQLDGRRGLLLPQVLLDRAEAGDELAANIVYESLAATGFAGAALVAAWDPGRLVLAGTLADAWPETLIEGLRAEIGQRCLDGQKISVEMVDQAERLVLLGAARWSRS